MPRLIRRSWPANPSAPGGRAERRAFIYQAFVPDPVAELDPSLPSTVSALLASAERAVDQLNRDPPQVASLEVLARRLMRAESVASSRIEGLVLSQRRLARAEAEDASSRDETARSVLGNVAAMERAVQIATANAPLRLSDILAIHRELMMATEMTQIAGRLRGQQNWIGGNSFNPSRAEFVPPPPDMIENLMMDLVAFLNRRDLSPLLQAAIAHAQFETIHPFADGSGRVGRALIHVVLRKRGLAPLYVPPVSLVLAAEAKRYVAGLTAYREDKLGEWIRLFAWAVERAADRAVDLAARLRALQERWRERAGRPRSHSSAEALIGKLPAHPIVTLSSAQALLGRSKQAANAAIAQLATASVLRPVSLAKRNRAWEARDLFALIDDFERELALPEE